MGVSDVTLFSKGDDTTEEEKKKSVVMGIQVVAGLSTEELSNATAGSKLWAMKVSQV